MKKNKLFLLVGLLLLLLSCNENETLPPTKKRNGKRDVIFPSLQKTKKDNITPAISFVNDVFLSQEKGPNTKGNSQKYTEEDVAYTKEISYIDGSPLLKLVCFKSGGYMLLNNIDKSKQSNVLYFTEENFDESNPNPGLIEYIEEFATRYEYEIKKQNTINNTQAKLETKSGDPSEQHSEEIFLINSKSKIVKKTQPLLKTLWGQRFPFNASCPIINGKHALVGCVAVATGQIMNYHRINTKKAYNWDKINTNNPMTSDLADFLHDIGKGVGMDYGLNKSGASPSNADLYFQTSGYGTYRNAFDFGKVRGQIVNKKYPVYLFGESKRTNRFLGLIYTYKGGHAWVADGYKKIVRTDSIERMHFAWGNYITTDTIVEKRQIEFIHMNWGWRGYKNAWVTYSSPNFGAMKEGEIGHKYKYRQGMLICY